MEIHLLHLSASHWCGRVVHSVPIKGLIQSLDLSQGVTFQKLKAKNLIQVHSTYESDMKLILSYT
jgi:hypothetical protein